MGLGRGRIWWADFSRGCDRREKSGEWGRYGSGGWVGFAATGEIPTAALHLRMNPNKLLP